MHNLIVGVAVWVAVSIPSALVAGLLLRRSDPEGERRARAARAANAARAARAAGAAATTGTRRAPAAPDIAATAVRRP